MSDETSPDLDDAETARAAMAEQLRAQEQITSPGVDAAFRVVPREVFGPADTPLVEAYAADDPVITKRDADGQAVSSISAPSIQARMLEMAGIVPGMRVLEIGSGGYNAALLAELVGPTGHVLSVDIDPDVVHTAADRLAAAGYTDRVTVQQADAEHTIAPTVVDRGDDRVFDRILVTVGAWDLPKTWLDALAGDGVLAVPLRMNGITRVIAFTRDQHGPDDPDDRDHRFDWDDRLHSTAVELAGFVPIQGDGIHPDHLVQLDAPHNDETPDRDGASTQRVVLRFDTDAPTDPEQLRNVLATNPTTAWSSVTLPHGTSFADLHLWLACFQPGFCRITTGTGSTVLGELGVTWFPFGAARTSDTGDAFATLVARPAASGGASEFGVRAYGPGAGNLAQQMIAQIHTWDRDARHSDPPRFAFHPGTTSTAATEQAGRVAVLPKHHGVVAVSWPAPA